jgi:hypothetical protein
LLGLGKGEMKDIYIIIVRKPEGKRSFGITKHRWTENIKIYLGGKGCESVGWIQLVQVGI